MVNRKRDTRFGEYIDPVQLHFGGGETILESLSDQTWIFEVEIY
jgi:hypothetical protein